MKKFIYNYIKPGNFIVSDAWGSYNWLSLDDNYNHLVHNHGQSDFCSGLESTRHIESVWSTLKNIIKNLFYSIPSKYFILFLLEAEFRQSISGFFVANKWHEFIDVLKYNVDIHIINLYSLEQLSSLTDRIIN